MKKLFALVICFIFMVAPAYAGPSFSAGGGGGGSAGSLTIATDCSSVVAEGAMCWDSDNNVLYIGDGAAAAPIGPGAGAGTITNVWTVATGNVNALVAASGDSFSAAAADSSIPWVVATDCSAVTADGRACWDSDDNILYIGDGATQVKIIKSGAIVNADIAAGAAITFAKLAALTSGNILVGSAGNVATSVTMSGDATIIASGAITIGDDKILEKHLKATNAATDEYILTYESTGGDFEWHSIAEMLSKIGDTRGSVLRRGATGWEAVTPGTVSYPLVSAGAGADPAYSQIVAAGITNNTITTAQLAATLTFSDGDLIDLSGITQSADTNEGLILPVWANVTTTGVTNGAIAWDNASLALKVKSTGGWQSIGATAAPVDPTYLTLGTNATLTNERVFTPGTGLAEVDGGAGSTYTLNFDPTKITGNRTWAAGGAATVAWTWDVSTGTDPSITFGNDLVTVNNGLTVATGKAIKLGTTQWNSGDSIDGTKVANADLGDITVTSGVWAVEDDSHAHTSSTLPATTAYTDAAAQTFTGASQIFGDADTDLLTIRSMVKGGNSREVQINAGTRTAPSNPSATPTQDLYVKGNIETPGTIYSAGLNTGNGTDTTRAITMVTNTALTPSGDQIYFINDALYFSQAGAQKTPMRLEDSQTVTGVKTFSGGLYAGDASTNSGIRFYDGSSNYWNVIAPTGMSTNPTFKLPSAQGATGTYLYDTDGAGTLGWGTPTATAHGSDTYVQFNDGGTALGSDAGFTYGKTTGKLTLGKNTVGGSIVIYNELGGSDFYAQIIPNASQGTGTVGSPMQITLPSYATTLLGSGANAFTGALTFSGSGTLTSPPITTAITPISAGGATLGTTALEWGNAYFTDSAVIYGQANQSATLTSSASKWTANNFGVDTDLNLGAGIKLTGGAGVVTFTDLAGTSEVLALDLRTADTAKLTTTSGVATFDLGAMNVVTTGTMSGKMPTAVYSADGALNVTTAQAQANTFFVNTYAGTQVMTLPAAAAGMAVCLRNGQNNSRILQVHSDGTDYLVPAATGIRNTAANHYAATASPTNQICLVAFDTTDWYITSTIGTWAEE